MGLELNIQVATEIMGYEWRKWVEDGERFLALPSVGIPAAESDPLHMKPYALVPDYAGDMDLAVEAATRTFLAGASSGFIERSREIYTPRGLCLRSLTFHRSMSHS